MRSYELGPQLIWGSVGVLARSYRQLGRPRGKPPTLELYDLQADPSEALSRNIHTGQNK